MALAAEGAVRCLRCGTLLRAQRGICPCCGWEKGAPPPAAEAPAESGRRGKAGMKICTLCMASTPEAELVEMNGQKLCPTCSEAMQKKANKAPPPPAAKA